METSLGPSDLHKTFNWTNNTSPSQLSKWSALSNVPGASSRIRRHRSKSFTPPRCLPLVLIVAILIFGLVFLRSLCTSPMTRRMHKLLSLLHFRNTVHRHLISFVSPQLTRNIDWILSIPCHTVPHTTESWRSHERIDVSNGTGRLLALWWRQCSTLEIITYDRHLAN